MLDACRDKVYKTILDRSSVNVNPKTGKTSMFGERLKLARKKAGYSLRALSEALDGAVSAQAIGKYERGEMMPGSKVLSRLAKTLGVSLEFLLVHQVKSLGEVDFRKRSGTSVKERARVEAEVIASLESYLAVEEVLDIEPDRWRDGLTSGEGVECEDDAEKLADKLRER